MSSKNIAGYSILEAEDMEVAKALFQCHPHLAGNADCPNEIYEAMPLPER
jgi:hypothetical protein